MKLSTKLALLGACILAPAAAAAEPDLIDQLFAKATELYAAQGYTATGWSHRGTMIEGDTQALAVTMQGGTSYQVVGVCDGKCSNLDLVVADARGAQVSEDVLDDDSPIVGLPKSGSYTLKVTMAKCDGTCSYGVISFKK